VFTEGVLPIHFNFAASGWAAALAGKAAIDSRVTANNK